MFGSLNDIEIDELLKTQIVGRLGCVAENRMYIIPISYSYDGEFIYAHTGIGMKLDIMRKNPKVCFQVDNTLDLGNWRSALAWGDFEELTTKEGQDKAMSALSHRTLPIITSETMRLSSQFPFNDENSSGIEGVFFRIRVSEKTGRFEKRTDQYYFAS